MPRPIGTPEELERRRRRIVELVEAGESPTNIARLFGVDVSSIHRWRRRARHQDGLKAITHPGPTPRLNDAQLQQLQALLLKGAKHHGWHNQLWTAARVAALIKRHFHVDYHPEHVRKILKTRLNWTSQKPRRKARERHDKEIERWKGDEFPRIVREAFRRQAHLVFLDESGFMLNPSVRRTLAPRGQTPILEAWDRRDRISAISCITLSPVRARPGLYFHLLPVNHTVHAEEVVEFLAELRGKLRGPFTVIWDRHKIHSKARAVQAYLAKHPEIVVEDLPAYAPEANPDEWVWSWTKYSKLSNLAAQNSAELWNWIIDSLLELKFSPTLLAAFLRDAELPVAA